MNGDQDFRLERLMCWMVIFLTFEEKKDSKK